jgi:serine acetyltransferase
VATLNTGQTTSDVYPLIGELTVGRGSVVGANSVLRKAVPPLSITVGSPARVVRMFNPISEQWEPVNDPPIVPG